MKTLTDISRKYKSYGRRQFYALIAVLALTLCACGTRDTNTEKVQKPTPTARQMTEQEKQDLLWERQYNTTKQCIYNYSLDEGIVEGYTWEESSMIQRDRQGKMLSYHTIDDGAGDISLLRVSQKHLCYAVADDFDFDNCTIHAVPIEQKDGKEQLLWEQDEQIVQANDTIYIAEPYLFYTQGKFLYCYDFESKKNEQILEGEHQIYIDLSENLIIENEGILYVADGTESEDGLSVDSNSFYCVDTKSLKTEKAYTATEGYRPELLAVSGNLLYIKQKNLQDGSMHIECYDREKHQTISVVEKKQLRQFLKTEKLIRPEENLKAMELENIFVSEERIYFHVYLNYDYKHKKKYTDADGYVLISAPREELTDLSNETVLNEWLFEHTAEHWIEECFTLCGDEIYLYLEDNRVGDEKTCMVGYHIKEQTLRNIENTESTYQQLAVIQSDIVWLGGSHWDDW